MSSVKRLKICYIIDNLAFRGGERVFAQLATELNPTEYNITVACSPGGAFVELLEKAGVRVVPFNMRPQFNPLALIQLTRFLRRERPHMVHCQGRGDPYGRIAARIAGVPVIISTAAAIVSRYWTDSHWRKALYHIIDRVTDPLVDQWIVLNQQSVEVLSHDHQVPTHKIAIIPNGIEVERYTAEAIMPKQVRQALEVPLKAKLIGAVGRLAWEKGFADLLNAMPLVLEQQPDVHLLIAGDGGLAEVLKAQAKQLGIADRCHFLGFRTDVPDILAALDVFVLSSLIEGMPMVLLEAMAAGKPVVATRIPGALDLVEDGIDGLLAPKQEPAALATQILQLLTNPTAAAQMGQLAQRKVRSEYTVERMVERTGRLYHALMTTQPVWSPVDQTVGQE